MTKCISSFIIEVVFLSFSIHSWIEPQPQQVINGILQLRKHLIGCKAFFHFSLWSGRLGVHCYLAQLNHSWALVILLGGSCDDQRLGNPTPRPNKVVHRRRAGPGGPFPITVHLMWDKQDFQFGLLLWMSHPCLRSRGPPPSSVIEELKLELQEMSLLLVLYFDQGFTKVLTSEGGVYFKKHCRKHETLSKVHTHSLR